MIGMQVLAVWRPLKCSELQVPVRKHRETSHLSSADILLDKQDKHTFRIKKTKQKTNDLLINVDHRLLPTESRLSSLGFLL